MTIPFWIKGIEFLFKKSTNEEINSQIYRKKVSLFSRIFRCWHGRLSRPFVEGKSVYRSCLKCGARRLYDPKTFQNYGGFYYPSVNSDNKD